MKGCPGSHSVGTNIQNDRRGQGQAGEGGKDTSHTAPNKGIPGSGGRGGVEIVATIFASKDGGPAPAATDTSAQTNAASIGRGGKQVWVHAFLWHQTRTICRIPVEVLVDTGAGGGQLRVSDVRAFDRTQGKGGEVDDQFSGTRVIASGQPRGQRDPSHENRGVVRAPTSVQPRGQGAQDFGKGGRGPPVRADHRSSVLEGNRKHYQLCSRRRLLTGTRVTVGTIYSVNGCASIKGRGKEGSRLAELRHN